MPTSPEEHLRLAESLDRQAEEFRGRIVKMAIAAGVPGVAELAKLADAAEELAAMNRESASSAKLEEAVLTTGLSSDTVETQMHVESAGAKRSAGQFTAEQLKHPFVAMLSKKKLSVGDVAKALDVPRTSMQAWYKPANDPGHRAIPEDVARKIRDKYGVPLGAWARIKAAK